MANAERAIVKKENKDDIEKMLKKFKNKVTRTGIIKNYRNRKEYIKPSEEKRKEKKKAIRTRKWLEENKGE